MGKNSQQGLQTVRGGYARHGGESLELSNFRDEGRGMRDEMDASTVRTPLFLAFSHSPFLLFSSSSALNFAILCGRLSQTSPFLALGHLVVR